MVFELLVPFIPSNVGNCFAEQIAYYKKYLYNICISDNGMLAASCVVVWKLKKIIGGFETQQPRDIPENRSIDHSQ